MTLIKDNRSKQRCKMTPPQGASYIPAVTGGYQRLPVVTGGSGRPPNKDLKQNGRSQQQIKYL
eukprot:2352466-Heterocapsa_arctica.AAC.1